MVRVEVRDRGTGMPPDVRRRAGEPFFTTKAPGRGLGLGLFLVRTFAERSGGTLEFEGSEGTTAILEIPAVGRESSALA
jgi:two-component system sensor histidine kinase RegB